MSATLNRMGSPIGPRMVLNDCEVDYFCGTSYHSLHGHPKVIEAVVRAVMNYGIGPATQATGPIYEEMIDRARQHFGSETATYVASGYLSIMVLMQALRDDYDVIFADSAAHFSIIDAIKSVEKPVVHFHHCDADHLAEQLRRHLKAGKVPLIVSDGVFPMTGAMAPLDDYGRILQGYPGGLLCVDDSHGVGVLGETGKGSLEHFGLSGPNIHIAGTLSKAFGGFGGILPGSNALAEKIASNVRQIAGASRPPIPAAAAAAMGLRLFAEEPQMLERLRRNVGRMRNGLRSVGLDIEDTLVPIVNVRAPSADLGLVCRLLETRGIAVRHVPPGGYSDAPDVETLRIAVFSTHAEESIDRLITSLKELL